MKYTINNNTIRFKQGNNEISVSIKELERILQNAKNKDTILDEKPYESADDLIYSMFDIDHHVVCMPDTFKEYYVSCNYGTVNPFSLGLWCKHGDKWYRISEYYYSSREKGIQLTDQEYYSALKEFVGNRPIKAIIIGSSAVSFIQTILNHGEYGLIRANDTILCGIQQVQDALLNDQIFFAPCCTNAIHEFLTYRWDYNAYKLNPKRTNDRAMDDVRFFVSTILNK